MGRHDPLGRKYHKVVINHCNYTKRFFLYKNKIVKLSLIKIIVNFCRDMQIDFDAVMIGACYLEVLHSFYGDKIPWNDII